MAGEYDCMEIEFAAYPAQTAPRCACPWVITLRGDSPIECARAAEGILRFHESKYATLPPWQIAVNRIRDRTNPPWPFAFSGQLPTCLLEHARSARLPQSESPVDPPGRRIISESEAISSGFWSADCAIRRTIMRETLSVIGCPERHHRLRKMAGVNLELWQKAAAFDQRLLGFHGPMLTVTPEDWGDATFRLTKQFGRCFAVLNMANADVPGGAYMEGAVAQEENMFRRTDCHPSLTDAQMGSSRDQYAPHMSRLLNGSTGDVYLDCENPRVCFRGREDPQQLGLGYRWLSDEEIFPFFELRASACDLRDGRQFDTKDCERRIAAQLDTLVRHGVRHVVLGALGCGAFGNPAETVAEVYRSQLDRRAEYFDVVAFAIYAAGYGPNNLIPFQRAFDCRTC